MTMYDQNFVNSLNQQIDSLRKEANQRYMEASDLSEEIRQANLLISSQNRELEVVTQERDNALRKIENWEQQYDASAERYGTEF